MPSEIPLGKCRPVSLLRPRVKCGPADLWTCRPANEVNCGPSLWTTSAFYPCVSIGKTLYSERVMPRNYGGTLTGEDVVCMPCINDTDHETMTREQCDVFLR